MQPIVEYGREERLFIPRRIIHMPSHWRSMTKNKKKKNSQTVGELAVPLLEKVPDTCDPILIQREMQKEYLDNLLECTSEHRKVFPGNFFVVVLTKNEKLLPNVFRNYFFARISCPTPDYDQSVFKFDSETQDLIFLWSIPSKDACIHLKENAILVAPEERDLLSCVLNFADGTLYKLAKQLNREHSDTNILQS